jgi:hypothetical protein
MTTEGQSMRVTAMIMVVGKGRHLPLPISLSD